jgi:hypothetical protein
MIEVTAIPVEGAWVRGPCKVRITKEQHARRISVLGPKYPRGGVFKLDGGQAINFKRGETFQMDAPKRLNKAIFAFDDPDEPDPKAGGASGDDTLVDSSGDDTFDDASGDDTVTGGSGDDTVAEGSGDDTVAAS